MINRVLISVYDKQDLRELVGSLSESNPRLEILSTGGTAKRLREWGYTVLDVAEYTGFPEIFEGRLKTLHPLIEGGILFRRAVHRHEAEAHGIHPIDMVVCNLYPFEEARTREAIADDALIEEVDIGGPTMIRAAAKNYTDVAVLVSPAQYGAVIAELRDSQGALSLQTRRRLAAEAFARTAAYDCCISAEFSKRWLGKEMLNLTFHGGEKLRYGENSHQEALVYFDGKGFSDARKLGGKEISYNNYLDFDAALKAVLEITMSPCCAVVKHNNPCGYATGETIDEALERAFEGDPMSAFGGIIALNRPATMNVAKWLEKRFVEGIIAPAYDPEALALLGKKQKLIILELPDMERGLPRPMEMRSILGGVLCQTPDDKLTSVFDSVTENKMSDNRKGLALFAYGVVKHVKSNAIALAREFGKGRYQLMGIGAGQPNRVQSVLLAIEKARENLRRDADIAAADAEEREALVAGRLGAMVLASDAFFPFPDSISLAAGAGVRNIIQPGGSQKDGEVIKECNSHGMAMVFTGTRHFKH
jgi:phosphoribosylaminoimidazolecarboxamide formyltransferase / IMP cyclohydrolase